MLKSSDAAAVVVLVVEGRHGTGFSVRMRSLVEPDVLATMLREAADQLEAS